MQEGGMSLCLPATLLVGNMGSWRDLLGGVFQSQTAFLVLSCFPSNTCFEWSFSLAGAAITDKPVPPPPPPWGNAWKLAVTKISKYLLLHSYWKWERVAPVAAGQKRTQGTLVASNMCFITCCMENKNKSVVTKPANNCLRQWAASQDYFILVELVTEVLWQLYESRNSLVFGT